MPEVNAFLRKKAGKKGAKSGEWDLSNFLAAPKPPNSPQRRPGRGDDSPNPARTVPAEAPVQGGIAEKTGNKPEPNLSQSEAKVEPNPGQTQDKPEPNLSQSEAKVEPTRAAKSRLSTKLSQLQTPQPGKVEPQLRPQVEPNLSQSEAKVEPTQSLSVLVGLQRSILIYVYESCRAEGSKTSAPISIENLATASKTTTSAARKAAQRLEQKGYIVRAQYKDGRGGWTQYAISDSTYNALLLNETRAKVEPNLSQTRAKVGTELEPQLRPSLPSSSSSVIPENLKTTTTGESELFDDGRVQLAPEWAAVDFSGLATVGFSRAHLVQLAQHGKLSATEVQDSIHFFAFDLKRNEKGREIKGPALNFFMGILRKGQPYAPPSNYESPEEISRREYLEGKRRLEERRRAEERELADMEFSEWRRGLSAAELAELLPEFARRPGQVQDSTLRTHFESAVWPEKGQALLAKFQQASAQQEVEPVSQQGST